MLRLVSSMALGLLIWAGLAGPGVAQAPAPPSPQPDSEIVVRAHQEQAIREFVISVAEIGRSHQIGRWGMEVCPEVVGVAPAQAEFIAQRIGEVAAPLELRRRTSECRTTLLVIVSNDAAGIALHFARLYPITLRTDGQAKLNLFAHTSRPVRWITVTDLCGTRCALPNSRITLPTHPEFQAMLILVDARQIAGFSLGELADYLAMVALANPRPGANHEEQSVLSMFDRPRPADGPFALTETDRSFLAGLYRMNPYLSAQSQRESIERHMRRAGAN